MMNSKSGFTLIEVIVVMVIIAIMAAIAMPRFVDWLPNMRLKAAARDLYSNMQKARMLAVKSNKSTAIIFDDSNDRYDLCDQWSSTPTPGCTGNIQSISLDSYKSGIRFGHGQAAQSVTGGSFPASDISYSSPVKTAVFNPDGLSNSGYVYLENDSSDTAWAVGTLSSGVIKILKWQNGGWR